jgi:hypothetical protein
MFKQAVNKQAVNKQAVNKSLNYLLRLFFLLYIVFGLDETTWMESSNENNPTIDSEESWCDYLNKNKYKIFGGCFVILTIILIINYYPPSNSFPPEIEIFKDLEVLKKNLSEAQYQSILKILTNFYNIFENKTNPVKLLIVLKYIDKCKERGQNMYISEELKKYFEED